MHQKVCGDMHILARSVIFQEVEIVYCICMMLKGSLGFENCIKSRTEELTEEKDHPSVQGHAHIKNLNSILGSQLHISRTEVLK